jgi:hypothetical protein
MVYIMHTAEPLLSLWWVDTSVIRTGNTGPNGVPRNMEVRCMTLYDQ